MDNRADGQPAAALVGDFPALIRKLIRRFGFPPTAPRTKDYTACVDPVSLGALVVSVSTLTWTVYNDFRQRQHSRNAKIEINRDGKTVVVEAKDLEKPEQAELFVKEILSRNQSDQG